MKTPLPEPAIWQERWRRNESGEIIAHEAPFTAFTESQLRAAMVAAYNEAMEDAASAIDPLEEWRGIDEKAYLIAVGIAKCIRELKKETP